LSCCDVAMPECGKLEQAIGLMTFSIFQHELDRGGGDRLNDICNSTRSSTGDHYHLNVCKSMYKTSLS
jgi:hypothetical protein